MKKQSQLRGWGALILAVILWSIFGYAYWTIDQQKIAYGQLLSSTQDAQSKAVSASRLHALIAETIDNRAFLQTLLPTDVVATVDAIDAVGKAAGVDIQISTAQPSNLGSSAAGINAVIFTVQTDGSFAQVSRLIRMFNTLTDPPTVVEDLDLNHAGTVWTMSARIRVLVASS